MTSITVTLPKKERQRLDGLAVAYGLSLEELSSQVLKMVAGDIPEENIEDYSDPKALNLSLGRALRDFQAGKVYKTL